ncbi:MAG: DUF4199 domain-containing protein [Bacteroidota bacterium]|nr:DUF4199 domain-containing protein [Bacteroidota bacterium]
MNDIEQRIKINGVKNGLLLGVIVTALSIISYYFITAANQSPALFVAAPIFFSVFIPIFCVVFFCFNSRKNIGGYWTFKQATTGIFTMFIVAYLIQFVAKDIVFDKFIEPGGIQKTQIAAINAKATILKQRGENPKAVESNIADMKKDFAQQQHITIGSTIQGVVISILFIFLLALIFGSLFKKDPPYAQPS